MNRRDALEQAARVLPGPLREQLAKVGDGVPEQAEELRLRRGRPMTVLAGGREVPAGGLCVTGEDLRAVVENGSQASAHAVLEQVRHGFLTLEGGHRMGLGGQVLCRGGEVVTMQELSSIALRIACCVEGQAEAVLDKLLEKGEFQNTLILAPPGVGKTTLLRDLIRGLSDGVKGECLRVGVADERGEIGALRQGVAQFYLGGHTDVVDGCGKAEGMEILLRGLNPQVLAVDEITRQADAHALLHAAGCGVALLATAHGKSMADLRTRPVYRRLLGARVFRRVILMQRSGAQRRLSVEVLS